MKTKNVIIFLLLFAFNLSIFHGFIMAEHEDNHNHCDIEHFINEFSSADMDHEDGDLCNSHYIYHIPYIIADSFTLDLSVVYQAKILSTPSIYPTKLSQKFIKPPIS
jgi:hypothetical protein